VHGRSAFRCYGICVDRQLRGGFAQPQSGWSQPLLLQKSVQVCAHREDDSDRVPRSMEPLSTCLLPLHPSKPREHSSRRHSTATPGPRNSRLLGRRVDQLARTDRKGKFCARRQSCRRYQAYELAENRRLAYNLRIGSGGALHPVPHPVRAFVFNDLPRGLASRLQASRSLKRPIRDCRASDTDRVSDPRRFQHPSNLCLRSRGGSRSYDDLSNHAGLPERYVIGDVWYCFSVSNSF
jgi:hypothetical protein